MGETKKLGSFEPAKGKTCDIAVSQNIFDVDNPLLSDTLKSVAGSDGPRMMLVADANAVNRMPGVGTAENPFRSNEPAILWRIIER